MVRSYVVAMNEPMTLHAGTEDLLDQARDGDDHAFEMLVRSNQRMVYSIAWHFFHDQPQAEDIAQDVFLRLYRNLLSIESDIHLTAWLRRVTVRRCLDHRRWLNTWRRQSLEAASELGAAPKSGDVLELERLRTLVAGLPGKLKLVVTLRFQEEMTVQEIAETLGWPVNSAKSRLHRALKVLRAKMKCQPR
jgi:RNA polymerase sigma-70 factor, ECF subfamily